jgi:hypothetical protein
MSKINNLLEELKLLELPEDSYVIVGSGPLGIRNIREVKDLDILVNDNLWNKLASKYGIISKDGNKVIKVSDDIEVLGNETFPSSLLDDPSVEDQIVSAELINGHPFQSISHFQYFKKMGKRQKDLDDIKLLQDWVDSR